MCHSFSCRWCVDLCAGDLSSAMRIAFSILKVVETLQHGGMHVITEHEDPPQSIFLKQKHEISPTTYTEKG